MYNTLIELDMYTHVHALIGWLHKIYVDILNLPYISHTFL